MQAFIYSNSRAQENDKPAPGAKVSLTENEWKAVQGIFQSSSNKDMYVEFKAADGKLVATLLWNRNEIRLDPQSPLVFSSGSNGEETVNISFIKDSLGNLNQVTVQNNGIWNRAKDYKPVTKQEMVHRPEDLAQFEGFYGSEGDGSRFIEIYVKDNSLFLKNYFNGRDVPFVPETPLNFFMKENPVLTLDFSKDQNGKIEKLRALRRDNWIKASKPFLTPEQLNTYAGKFKSVDDADNMVELLVKQGSLVMRQLWDNREIVLKPRTDTYFYNDEKSFPLVVLKDKNGVIDRIVIMDSEEFTKMK